MTHICMVTILLPTIDADVGMGSCAVSASSVPSRSVENFSIAPAGVVAVAV